MLQNDVQNCPTPRTTFPVVCLLASAGGLEALTGFFRAIPGGQRMAFLVLQHFPSDQPTMLAELLGRHSALGFRQAVAGDQVEPGVALILSAGQGLAWVGATLTVAQISSPTYSALSGDLLFESASECLEDQAIGVVLSGTGTDGTLGLKAIRGRGGQTFAQAPSAAQFQGMPSHAIDAGVVDWVLPAEEMPKRMLEDFSATSRIVEEEQSQALQGICAVLSRKTGNDFSRYKLGTLHRRLNRRMQLCGMRTLTDYLAFLEIADEEVHGLLNDLLIGVTEFFRDPEAFQQLERQIQAALSVAGDPQLAFRIWVPGCSSGEEAYSIAILVREQLDRLGSGRRVQIFATDIDMNALLQAKAGHYFEPALRNLSPERRQRFFSRDANGFRVTKELREMCVFSVQNLLRDPPFSGLDLISCRNVFIYLQQAVQRKLIPLFHFALKPKGLLFMGSAEGLGAQTELFEPLDKASRIYGRREGVHRLPVEFPVGERWQTFRSGPQAPRGGPGASANPDGLFERMLLEEYVPASAIINEAGDVLFCAGRIGRFMQPPLGVPTHNLLHSTSGPLRRELRSQLARVARDRAAKVHSVVQHDSGLGEETLKVTLRPMPGLERDAGVYAVIIESEPSAYLGEVPARVGDAENPLLDQLERELRATQGELQATVEELGSTTEEFRSSNEELQTANEELQTSQEELQSVNEELTTINNELQQKIQELRETNGDLQNLLVATDIATVFMDPQLRISRFTPPIKALFRLMDGDLGRSILDFVPLFEGADFSELAAKVLATQEPVRVHVHSLEQERWFILQLLPYRALGGEVTGLVATFVDITEIIAANRELADSEERFRKLFENMVNGYAHCLTRFEGDQLADFYYLAVNQAFQTQTGLGEVVGKWVSEVIPGIREADPGLFEIYGRVARTGIPERFEMFVEALGDWYDVSVHSPRPNEFVAVFEVVTERKERESSLRAAEERFSMAFHASPDAIEISRISDSAYLMVNSVFIDLFGYPTPEVLGKSAVELGIWADSRERSRWHDLLRDQGQVSCLEVNLRRADGTPIIGQVSSRHVLFEGVPAQLSIIRDISEHKREEAERQLMQAEIEHMQKVESLGRLAGGVAHDMNNVLGAIYAVTQTIRCRYADDGELDEALAIVERAATRGRDLVQGLVGFSRKDLPAAATIDLNDLVRKEVALLDRTLMQKFRVDMDLEEPLAAVQGDTGSLGSALMNLCVNAVDAMAPGGTLTIRTRRLPEDKVQLTVEDNGSGMPPEVLHRAMEPFFTTKPFGKGTGLGLATVFNTARAHGGTLALQSEPGQGTRAILTLPCRDSASLPEETAEPAAAEPETMAILFVDDDELLRESVPMLLEVLGHRVTALDGGRELLARLAAAAIPDLVIMDVNMPGMNGLEALARVRKEYRNLPVLLATGNLDDEVEAVLRADDRSLAISKPFTLRELQLKLGQVKGLRA
jgi:two-component system CheB/CheR fusion protein